MRHILPMLLAALVAAGCPEEATSTATVGDVAGLPETDAFTGLRDGAASDSPVRPDTPPEPGDADGASSTDPGPGDDGGGTLDDAHAGPDIDMDVDVGSPDDQIVGRCRVRAPEVTPFVLRCVLPLPKGVFPRADGMWPFGIVDIDDQVRPAQVDVVSRYSNYAADGADVVELSALVENDPAASPGDELTYDVVLLAAPQPATTATPLYGALRQSILEQGSLQLTSTDVFDNTYSLNLLNHGTSDFRRLTSGEVLNRVRLSGSLTHKGDSFGPPSGALLRFLHSISYMTVTARDPDILRVSFDLNNAVVADEPDDGAAEWQRDLFFSRIRLVTPGSMRVVCKFSDPWLGVNAQAPNGNNGVNLVKPAGGGALHVLAEQGQLGRRDCAVGPADKLGRMNQILMEEGLAFNTAGDNPDGAPLWSWWNPATARFMPQKMNLPIQSANVLADMQQGWQAQLDKIEAAVTTGADQDYPFPGSLGPYLIIGVPYGGMTGGDDIRYTYGSGIATAGALEGIHALQLKERAYASRHPCRLLRADGEPLSLADTLKPLAGGGQYSDVKLKPGMNYVTTAGDPLGKDSAPGYQVDEVTSQDKLPGYADTLDSYQCIDFQHAARAGISSMALAFISNDPLSRDWLRSLAHLYTFYANKYPLNADGAPDFNRGGDLWNEAVAAPNTGVDIGREDGWGLWHAAAAYSFRRDDGPSNQFLSDWARWYIEIPATAISCNGNIQRLYGNGKLFDDYLSRMHGQQLFVLNGLAAVERNFYDHDDFATERQQAIDVLTQFGDANVAPMNWNPATASPYPVIAVAPLSDPTSPFCALPEPPVDWLSYGSAHLAQSILLTHRLNQNPVYLERLVEHANLNGASVAAGDVCALSSFWNGYGDDDQRAGLMAYLQALCAQQ